MLWNIFVLALLVSSFVAGLKLDHYYREREAKNIKDALERQFVRLRANADADDPCRPYGRHSVVPPATGDYDGDCSKIITPEFMERLKKNGQASTKFKKSDLAK